MVKQRFLSLLFLLNIGSVLYAMGTIQLPLAKTLRIYLCEKGFEDFVAQTGIDKTLGDIELYPLGIVAIIEKGLNKYAQSKENLTKPEALQMRQELIECILQEVPKGIVEELIKTLKRGSDLL